jgi:hypothetical protein
VSANVSTAPKNNHFRVTYRGIQINDGGDRWGSGVDPYFVAGFIQVAPGGGIATLMDSHLVKPMEDNLGVNSATQWYPSGGDDNNNGKADEPLNVYPKLRMDFSIPEVIGDEVRETPRLSTANTYLLPMSVWEMDGNDAAIVMENVSYALSIASMVAGATGAGSPVAAVLSGLASAMDFASLIAGLAAADDQVEDVIVIFDSSDILDTGVTKEVKVRANGNGLDWNIYLGRKAAN